MQMPSACIPLWQPNLDETTQAAWLTKGEGAGRTAGFSSELSPTLSKAESWPMPSLGI